ncbi:hypothetical protein [Rhodoblastus sp.]|uniref:hypothetical protein n=1 Tax=Rhodoblastus sp. TaxID=1962975 RepID=UPI003F9B951D
MLSWQTKDGLARMPISDIGYIINHSLKFAERFFVFVRKGAFIEKRALNEMLDQNHERVFDAAKLLAAACGFREHSLLNDWVRRFAHIYVDEPDLISSSVKRDVQKLNAWATGPDSGKLTSGMRRLPSRR